MPMHIRKRSTKTDQPTNSKERNSQNLKIILFLNSINVYELFRIKICCDEAKINQPHTITKYPGNKRLDITEPKYNFVVVHTARKTFINLAHKYNMHQSLIMDIVGHSEYETFLKYRKYEPEKKKEDMEKAFKNYTERIQAKKNK